MASTIKICPSILAADAANLGQAVADVTAAGADLIHIDVMDGHFVPEITFGPHVVKALKKHTHLPLDVHLMVAPVAGQIEKYAAAGADFLSFHPEADYHPHRIAGAIAATGCRVGMVFNPTTDLSILDTTIHTLDMILIMSINPGYGGQSFLPETLPKIAAARARIEAAKRPIILQVDGGVNEKTAPACIAAGADALVAGTAIFSKPADQWAGMINGLRG